MQEKEKTTRNKTVLHDICNQLINEPHPLTLVCLEKICVQQKIKGHLAILNGDYIEKILSRRKTIESRFSKKLIPPFRQIKAGDVLFLKQSAGDLLGLALVSHAEFFDSLDDGKVENLMTRYQEQLQLDDDFIKRKRDSNYASLVHIDAVLATPAISIEKRDRRSWVTMKATQVSMPEQLPLFQPYPDCENNLHTYHKSERRNSNGHRICKWCGNDSIDWQRIHEKRIDDSAYTISQLKKDAFRYEWWTKPVDQHAINHALRKGKYALNEAADKRLKTSVGNVYTMPDGIKRPYRDGIQTPEKGNIIYYAQHALACCCRKCMEYWHGISYGRDLTEEELKYFTQLIALYIAKRIPELHEEGIYVPPIKRKT